MAAFALSKWYLDQVTDSGDVAIAYTGTVKWGPVRLNYSSLLESTAGVVGTRYSFRPQSQPSAGEGSLRWQCEALGIDAEWRADSTEIRETIFYSDAGRVEWRCLMPRAHARIDNRLGLGYAEHLRMTVAPWQLPIETLRWGRFATPSEWIVWIDWLGDFTRRIVYRNGEVVPTARIDDGQLEFIDGARLTLDCSLVLRAGRIGDTALAAIPGVRDTFPARLLRLNELRWRSRGQFERPGMLPVEGWAIHERVEWPK